MSTKFGDSGEPEVERPPEVIIVDDENPVELAFRDERVADEDGFTMPEPHD